jgi:hypothetical protein
MTDMELVTLADVGLYAGPYGAIALGLVAGALSMVVYSRLSPQAKIVELKGQLGELQREISAYDGDFAGALTLTRQNLRLAFRRLGLALGPALASGVPVLAAIPLIGESYVSYFVAVALSAIAVKIIWKIA